MKTFVVVASTAILLGSQAQAQRTIGDILKGIERRSSRVQIQKQQTAVPTLKSQGTSTQQVLELTNIQPKSSSELLRPLDQNYAQLEKVLNQEIEQLETLIKKFRRSQQRGEIWLRLAEAYVDKSKLIENRIQENYQQQLEKYIQAGQKGRRPKLDLEPAQLYNRSAVKLYELYLKDFPGGSKLDQAYFFLGFNYFQLDNIKQGLFYYNKLVTEVPNSRYVDEGNFALGEYYFDNEKWAQSLEYYNRIITNPKSRLYQFALYKAAWSNYKLRQVKTGLKYLELVVRAEQSEQGTRSRVSRLRLAEEARRDIIVFFAESGTYKNAKSYFRRVFPKEQIDEQLEKLAFYYSSVGQRKAARYFFEGLIRDNPNSPRAYEYQYQIVSLYQIAGNTKVFLSELYEWIKDYGPRSSWARNNQQNTELISKSQKLIETTLRTYVLQQHQTAQNSRDPNTQTLALNGYNLYFQTFEKTPQLGNMHFFYGELLFDMKKYRAAAEQYLWVSENDKENKFYNKAVLNALLAIEKDLPTQEQIKKVVGNSKAAVPLDSTTKTFEKVAQSYFVAHGNSKDSLDIRFRLGTLYYFYNHFNKAIESFKVIYTSSPKHQYAIDSAHLVLDIYNGQKDFENLRKEATAMLEVKDLVRGKFKDQINKILVRTSFKQAQNLEEVKDYKKSAESYESFANQFKGSDLATGALFNAAVNFERVGEVVPALKNYERVLESKDRRYAGLRKKALKFTASLYERTGQYAMAAKHFEKYASLFPKDPESPSYWLNAAIIRQGMNDRKLAARNYAKHYQTSKAASKSEALYYIARIEEDNGRLAPAVKQYEKFIDENPQNAGLVVDAAFRIGLLSEKLGRSKTALEWYQKTVRIQGRLKKKVGVPQAAESLFRLVYRSYLEMRAINIPRNPKRQKAALDKKIAVFERLKGELKQVIAYDDGFQIVASLATLGQANQHLSSAIFNSPIPKGFGKEDVDRYKAQLAKFAQPFKDGAINAYRDAIEKAFRFEAYGPWVDVAMKEMNGLKPGSYPETPDRVLLQSAVDRLKVTRNDEGEIRKLKIELAKMDLSQSSEQKVIDIVSQILSTKDSDPYALNSLALLYYYRKQYGLAKLILDRASKEHPSEPAFSNNYGVIFLAQGEMRDAIAEFRRANDKNQSYDVSTANLGSIYLRYRDYNRALEPLEIGYRRLAKNLSKGSDEAIAAANNYALVLRGLGKTSKSKAVFERVLSADGKNPEILLNYAILQTYDLKEKSDALKTISRIKLVSRDTQLVKDAEGLEDYLNAKN